MQTTKFEIQVKNFDFIQFFMSKKILLNRLFLNYFGKSKFKIPKR